MCHATATPQLGGGTIERDTWNIRIHAHIKEYFRKKGVNPREILEDKYYEMKNNELPELLKEKEEHLKRVAQIDSIVPQLRADCATEFNKIDTISKDYVKTGRSIDEPTRQDMFWLNSRCKNAQITVESVLERCKELCK